MKKENIYLDLSKCTEDQIKALPTILENAGEYMTSGFRNLNYYATTTYCYIQLVEAYWSIWDLLNVMGKQELTYPEFIELFDGGEGDNNGWIEMEKTQPEIGSLIVHARERDNGDIYYEIEKVTEEFLRWADWNGFKFWKYFTPEPPKF